MTATARKTALNVKFMAYLMCVRNVLSPSHVLIYYFFKDFIYLFLERGEGRKKRKGEKHWLVASRTHPNQGTNPQLGMCSDWELNWTLLLCGTTPNKLNHIGQG